MKMSQWCWAVKNRCIVTARSKALADRSGDRSAGSIWMVRRLRNFAVQLQSGHVEPVEC